MKAQKGFRRFHIRGVDKEVRELIKDVCKQIVAVAAPEKIILFGSYAHGQPHKDSDVDLLVVMPFDGHPAYQATKIRMQIKAQLPLDLLVRTPQFVAQRLEMGDFFMQDVVEQGKVIYEADHARVDRQSGGRLGKRAA